MTEFAKDTIERLETFLRAIAPGFVLLLALALADIGRSNHVIDLFHDKELIGLGAGVLFGLISYSLHFALFEDWFMRLIIREIKRCHPQDIPDALMTMKAVDIIPFLSRERWTRPVAENKKSVALQASLSRSYSWFIFLYCSGYLLVIGALWLYGSDFSTGLRVALIATTGVFLILAGLVADTKATRHEIWLCRHYSQQLPESPTSIQNEPNQSVQPTPGSVTPRAIE